MPTLSTTTAILFPSTFFDAPGTTVTWDVDGVGGVDFELFVAGFNFSSGLTYSGQNPYFSNRASVQLASRDYSYNPLNGRGLVAPFPTDNVQALPAGFNVGPTLANYTWGSGSVSGYRYRNAMQAGSGISYYGYSFNTGPTIGYDFDFGFAPGDNFFGFRFEQNGNLHYGWAEINFDLNNTTVTINRWAYESVAGRGIEVGAIPEPTSALALLTLGAVGLMTHRGRRSSKKNEE